MSEQERTATVERVAYLLWQVNEGYLAPEDRAVGTNWFAEPVENLHPADLAERPHWVALAEEVIAEVRRLDSGSEAPDDNPHESDGTTPEACAYCGDVWPCAGADHA